MKQKIITYLLALLCAILYGIALYLQAWAAPAAAPQSYSVVTSGSGLEAVSSELEAQGVIRSAFWFQLLTTLQGRQANVVAGTYDFSKEQQNIFTVIRRVTHGDYQVDRVAVTIPEGLTVREMAPLFAARLPAFSESEWLEKALPKEGYLFPDTYFFLPDSNVESVLSLMSAEFEKKTEAVNNTVLERVRAADLDSSDLKEITWNDIITLASIVEKEVAKSEDRPLVAGVLWHRLVIGMPLQVDAAFLYDPRFAGRTTYELTADDLKTDSPYNTYLNRGLPPTPIGNPGLESIIAAANPEITDYLYYLSSLGGTTYFAETFAEHVENRKYLEAEE